MLEEEKQRCIEEYNNLLKENINLRSKDESFEVEKIKDALEEISSMGNLHKEAEQKISKLQNKYHDLNKECTNLTDEIMKITKNLDSLNIDNSRLNNELSIINKELFHSKKKLNKSFSNEQVDNKEFLEDVEVNKESELNNWCTITIIYKIRKILSIQ